MNNGIKVYTKKEEETTAATIQQDFEQQIAEFEREYGKLSVRSSSSVSSGDEETRQHHAAVHAAYGELYNAVPMDMVFRMKAAMKEIPEVSSFFGAIFTCCLTILHWQGIPGLQDCQEYLSQKQHYTLLDMLVCQYILNGGILMRQQHNTDNEHHVDLSSSCQ